MASLPPSLGRDDPWFAIEPLGNDIFRLFEPHVSEFMQSNIWFLRGQERDLLVDTGNGIASLFEAIAPLHPRNLLTVATHGHADHVGSLHEFPGAMAHAGVIPALERADPDTTLAGPGYAIGNLGGLLVGPPSLEGPLATARPWNFDPAAFGPKPARSLAGLCEGQILDLGDRCLEVLHLPGHSPFCMALLDRQSGLLIVGDVVYEGQLVDDLHHSDREAYRVSLNRLSLADVGLVLPGHGPAIDGHRLRALVAAYLRP